MCMVLFSKSDTGEARELSKKQCSFGNRRSSDRVLVLSFDEVHAVVLQLRNQLQISADITTLLYIIMYATFFGHFEYLKF